MISAVGAASSRGRLHLGGVTRMIMIVRDEFTTPSLFAWPPERPEYPPPPPEGVRHLPECPGCGYSFEGLPSHGVCPECARPFDEREVMIRVRAMGPRSRFWILGFQLVLLPIAVTYLWSTGMNGTVMRVAVGCMLLGWILSVLQVFRPRLMAPDFMIHLRLEGIAMGTRRNSQRVNWSEFRHADISDLKRLFERSRASRPVLEFVSYRATLLNLQLRVLERPERVEWLRAVIHAWRLEG